MNLTRMGAPALGAKGVQRLREMCRAKRLTKDSNMFEVGYEEAKRDILAVLNEEEGRL